MKKFFKLAVEISMLAFEKSAKFIKNHKTEIAFAVGAIGAVVCKKQKPKESKPGTIVVFVPIATESEEKEAED